MLESSDLPSVRLPPDPPLGQLRATPTESDVSAESCVGNWVRTSTSALIPHPTGRDTPPLGELLGGQNFKERTLCWCVLCSELCSSGFHRFPFKELQCMAVRRTAIFPSAPFLKPDFHFQGRQNVCLPFLALILTLEVDRASESVVKLHTMPQSLHQTLTRRTALRISDKTVSGAGV